MHGGGGGKNLPLFLSLLNYQRLNTDRANIRRAFRAEREAWVILGGWRERQTSLVCGFEQRQSERWTVSWPVSVWHPQAGQFFNGHSINVSGKGALLTLPMRAPVCEGQDLELNFPRSEALAEDKGVFARIKKARVVRVDRGELLSSAVVKVGLVFCDQLEPSAVPV